MLLFYVDECGGTSMTFSPPPEGKTMASGSSELFVMSAVGIHDSSREPLAHEIEELKLRNFGAKAVGGTWADTELKGKYLAHLARHFAGTSAPDVPKGYRAISDKHNFGFLLRDLGQLFAKFRPTIFTVIVDKRELTGPHAAVNPLGAAYSRLYERVALTLQNVNGGEGGIFVADRQDEHEVYFKSGAMHQVRRSLASKGINRPDFNLLLDKPLWIDPTLSTWDREIIQLADIVAYSSYEWWKERRPPSERHFLWDKISPCFAAHWNTTKAQGGGIIVYPDPGKYPAI